MEVQFLFKQKKLILEGARNYFSKGLSTVHSEEVMGPRPCAHFWNTSHCGKYGDSRAKTLAFHGKCFFLLSLWKIQLIINQ